MEERLNLGKERSATTPRAEQAEWKPPADRPDPVDLLNARDALGDPDLIPTRHARLLESPFAFLGGDGATMAWDLSKTATTGIRAQLAGDAHLVNFGACRTPEQNLVFDIRDFDETLPGPFEWDLKRLAASIVVAGRTSGFSDAESWNAARAAVTSYRQRMALYALSHNLELYHTRVDVDDLLDIVSGGGQTGVRTDPKASGDDDDVLMLDAMSTTESGQVQITEDLSAITRLDNWTVLGAERGAQLFRTYYRTLLPDRRHLLQRYTLVDAARKVGGSRSGATRCFILLFMGATDDDLLFLQVKQATESVLEPYLGASGYQHHGERVVAGGCRTLHGKAGRRCVRAGPCVTVALCSRSYALHVKF